jgi:imidazole glycerol-phosphate synthase subunit HisH
VIALIDYGAGNLTSVKKALSAIGADVFVPERASDLQSAAAVIVPGVGHFGATSTLDRSWMDAIRDHVARSRPLLGICLGVQWLFDGSDEAPAVEGLGLLRGRCYKLGAGAVRLEADTTHFKVPHVGWNSLELRRGDSWIAAGVCSGAQVYFTHSYVAPLDEDTVATTDHGETFAAIVERGAIAGVQFHPEKSGDVGLRILRNFLRRTAD